jgi:8-oxo-dGTP pyrophosphatase MutT (NUDIX family)
VGKCKIKIKDMYEKSLGAGLFAICPETGRFLLIKRRNDVKFPEYWSVPGGNFDEEDGYPKRTAVREFREETGYKGPVKISKEPIYIKTDNHVNFYVYVGILPFEFVPNLQGEGSESEPESLAYSWVPVTCKWDENDKVVPSVITVMDTKADLLAKVINKFKDKNF